MVVKTKKHFSSQKEKVGLFAIDVDNSEIKKEPMFFNSDFDYAYLNGNGWRWFGRISRNTDRVKTVTNEIRMNAQVYLEFPMEGW